VKLVTFCMPYTVGFVKLVTFCVPYTVGFVKLDVRDFDISLSSLLIKDFEIS